MKPDGSKPVLNPLPRVVADRITKHATVAFPPDGYDPRGKPADELLKLGLPPPPSRTTASLAYRNWERAMSPPLVFPPKPLVVSDLFAVLPEATRLARFAQVGSLGESSRNWSGAYVRPRNPGAMVLVQARWTVGTTRAPTTGDEFAVSTWVGLDGNDAATQSMPQIGTQVASLNDPSQSWLLAWWQWWIKPDPDALQVVIQPLPVEEGDEIYAQVHEVGPATASFFIKNLTQGIAFALVYTLPNPWGPGPTPAVLGIEGRTAEWIVERPLVPLHAPKLGDFGEVAFTACNAAVRRGGSGILVDVPLDRARLVALHDWEDRQRPGRLVSKPRRKGAASFSLTYMS
jgi:hypothetical protein